MRLYSDLNVNSTVIYEEIAYELELKFEELTGEGLLDALISMKSAPTNKVKSILYELEQTMLANTAVLNI